MCWFYMGIAQIALEPPSVKWANVAFLTHRVPVSYAQLICVKPLSTTLTGTLDHPCLPSGPEPVANTDRPSG